MPINLSHPTEERQATFHKKKQLIDTGIIISCGIAVVTLLVLGGLKYYNFVLQGKIESADKEIKADNDLLTSAAAKDSSANIVSDFAVRLAKAQENISGKRDPVAALKNLESTVVSGANLESYTYNKDKNSLLLTMAADSFPAVARQLLNFKKSEYFQDVMISGISRTETSKIGFTIDMKIAK